MTEQGSPGAITSAFTGRPLGRRAVAELLDTLFAEAGLSGARRFGTQQEGTLLPGGPGGRPVEALSGFALAPTRLVYRFWLAYDATRARLVLDPLTPISDLGVLADDPEYLNAMRRIQRQHR